MEGDKLARILSFLGLSTNVKVKRFDQHSMPSCICFRSSSSPSAGPAAAITARFLAMRSWKPHRRRPPRGLRGRHDRHHDAAGRRAQGEERQDVNVMPLRLFFSSPICTPIMLNVLSSLARTLRETLRAHASGLRISGARTSVYFDPDSQRLL